MVNYTNHVNIDKKKRLYSNMKTRCYNQNYLNKNPAYNGCMVCDEWLDNRQSFFEWVDHNYYTCGAEQMDLDKDILLKGNKIYSPETCIFAPHSINTYFETLTRKPVYLPELKKWKASMSLQGKTVTIGYFDTEEEAKQEYIRHKEASLLAKADLYKDRIPDKLYKAMVNRKIELTDWK